MNDPFDQAIADLRENIQTLANKNVIGRGQLAKYNRIYQNLLKAKNTDTLAQEAKDTRIEQLLAHITRLYGNIQALEAIILLHGIDNVNIFLASGPEALTAQVYESRAENYRIIPTDLINLIDG